MATTSHLQKAAVVLASLPEDVAAGLLERLPPHQASAVAEEMGKMGAMECDEHASVAREFRAARSRLAGAAQCCPADRNVCPTPPGAFEFLHDADPETLLAFLVDERPQTIALVLAHLPDNMVAQMIGQMPLPLQTAVIRRIATMGSPCPEIVGEVAASLHRRMAGDANPTARYGMTHIVKMLGAMRPATERRLLGQLAAADPDLFRDIRTAMFGPDVAAICEAAGAL